MNPAVVYYNVVWFLDSVAIAAGAKVALVSGKYLATIPPGITIQAINGSKPPQDQSALVASLQTEVARLNTKIANALAAVA